jgi:hypothetical protein
MKRQPLILLALSLSFLCSSVGTVSAGGPSFRGSRSIGQGHHGGFGHGFGLGGVGFGGGGDYGWDISELYRQLYNNLPYFALHPPVYYSTPVPRTYGYSPFAYGPDVMTPEVVIEAKPVTIINPFVPAAPADPKTDRAASTSNSPEPLVIVNPFVTTGNVAKSGS